MKFTVNSEKATILKPVEVPLEEAIAKHGIAMHYVGGKVYPHITLTTRNDKVSYFVPKNVEPRKTSEGELLFNIVGALTVSFGGPILEKVYIIDNDMNIIDKYNLNEFFQNPNFMRHAIDNNHRIVKLNEATTDSFVMQFKNIMIVKNRDNTFSKVIFDQRSGGNYLPHEYSVHSLLNCGTASIKDMADSKSGVVKKEYEYTSFINNDCMNLIMDWINVHYADAIQNAEVFTNASSDATKADEEQKGTEGTATV